MPTTSLKLPELIEFLEEDLILLPEFQREFVWNKMRRKKCLDTVLRDMNIGAILISEDRKELRISARSVKDTILAQERIVEQKRLYKKRGKGKFRPKPDFEGILTPDKLPRSPLFMLDGQQRTTSFGEALGNFDEPRDRLFTDLVKMAHPNWETNMKDLSYLVFKPKQKIRDEEGNLVEKHEESLQQGRFMWARTILDPVASSRHLQEYFGKNAVELFGSENTETLKQEAIARVSSYFERARAYEIKVIRVPRTQPIEKVREQFERTNLGGIPLSPFDLAVNRYVGAKINIRYEWHEFVDNSRCLSRSLTPDLRKQGLDVLAICVLATTPDQGSRFGPYACHELDPKEVAGGLFHNGLRAMEKAYEWGRDHVGCYYKDLIPVHAPFLGLAANLLKYPTFLEEVPTDELKRWFYAKFFVGNPPTWAEKQRCFQSLERAFLEKKVPEVRVYVPPRAPFEANGHYSGSIDTRPRVTFRALRCLAYGEGDLCDLRTGVPLRELAAGNHALHSFHIYPKSKAPELDHDTETACNLLVSTRKTNSQTGTDVPSVYLRSYLRVLERNQRETVVGMFGDQKDVDAIDILNERLRRAFLLSPDGPFRTLEEIQGYFAEQNMPTVLKNRANALWALVEDMFGASLVTHPLPPEESEEDLEEDDDDGEYDDEEVDD